MVCYQETSPAMLSYVFLHQTSVDLIYPALLAAMFWKRVLLVLLWNVQIDTFHYSVCCLLGFSFHTGLVINSCEQTFRQMMRALDFYYVAMTENWKADFQLVPDVTKALCLSSASAYQVTY